MKRAIALILVAIFVIPSLAAFVSEAGLVQTIVTKRIEDDTNALGSLTAGETQARLFPLDAASQADAAMNLQKAGFQLLLPASGMDNLLFNPNHCADESLNIFTNRKVRFAMQFLVPRTEIVANIFKGYGIPQYIPWTPQDPDYPYLIGTALKIEFMIQNKGPEYGAQLLEEGLTELGATKGADGKWYYNGEPVTVKFIIRVEDARKDIGELVAQILEQQGITVEYLYKDFSGALSIVYFGDPTACEWHIYTEGWGIGGLTKYDYGNFVWFLSNYWGSIPVGDYANETIDKIAERLDTGNYTDENEYWQLVNEGVWLGFHEAVRVFIVATKDIYLAAPGLGGIVQSPKATPWNPYTYVSLSYENGDTVYFSNRYVYKEGWPWNPVGGWADAYSTYAVENAISFSLGVTSRITDGTTGWSPLNATTWKVEPDAVVPDNAIVYDPVAHKFVTAAEAGKAGLPVANKVILNYKYLPKVKFHDGTQMTIADFFSGIYVGFEWGVNATTIDPNAVDTKYEKRIYYAYSTLLATFGGVEIINDTAIAVYTNYTHIDPGMVAAAGDLWHNFPLELYAAMDLLVSTNDSIVWHYRSQNTEQGIYALHLIDPAQVQQMVSLMQAARNNPPSWVQDLIDLGILTLEEWQARVDNLLAFAQQYGHLVIGNGPFYLESYDSVNDAVTLKRWTGFPLTEEEINALYQELMPRTVSLTTTVLPLATNTAGSPIATLTIEVNGQPATAADIIPFAVLINLDTFESIFLEVTEQSPGQFQVVLPQDMPEGYYQLSLMVYPKGYSDPAIDVQVVNLVAPPPQTETTTTTQPPAEETTTTTTTTQPPAQETTTTTTTSPAAQPPAEQPAETTTTPAEGGISGTVIAAIIIVIIIVAAAYYFLRK